MSVPHSIRATARRTTRVAAASALLGALFTLASALLPPLTTDSIAVPVHGAGVSSVSDNVAGVQSITSTTSRITVRLGVSGR